MCGPCRRFVRNNKGGLRVVTACEHGNEPSGPIKDVEFFDYQLLNENHPPWGSSLRPVFG
jgi:hypothetical protein